MGEVASAFVSLLPSAAGFGSKLTGQVGGEVSKSGGVLGGVLGKTMLAGFVAAGVVVGVGKALYDIGSEFDDVSDTIRVSTGKSGAALQALDDVAKSVGQNVPVSFDQIGPVVADLNRNLGLTGKPLQILSEQFLDLGHITGQAIDTKAVSGALNLFNVKGTQSSVVMDQLFRVSQSTGIGFNDLTASLQRNGPNLSQFGFSIQQSASLIGTLSKAGLDSNKTLGTLSHAMATFAKDGKDPQKALQGTITQIQGFIDKGDQAGAVNVASKVFGTRGATQFVAALRSGRINMQSLTDATKGNHDSIIGATHDTADFAEKWQLFKNRTLVALEPVATRVFNAVGDGASALGPAVTSALAKVGPELANLSAKIAPFVTSFQRGVLPVAQAAGVVFQTKILPAVVSLGRYLGATLIPVLTALASFIRGSVMPVWQQLGQFIYTKVVPALIAVATSVAHSLKPTIDQLANTFRTQLLPALRQAFVRFEQARPTLEKIALALLKVTGFVLKVAAAILGKLLPPLIRLIGFIVAQAIKGLTTFILQLIKTAGQIVSFGTALVNAVKFAIRFETGVIQAGIKVVDWFKKLPGKITGFFATLPGKLSTIGTHLIGGLVAGITGSVHLVWDEIKKIANGLPGWFKKLWHIHSPSGVTADIGDDVMRGLALGIERSAGTVQKAAEKATGKLIKTLRGKLKDLQSTFQGLVDPIAQAFTGDLFSATSAGSFIASLTATKGTLTNLTSAFKTLLGWGLSPGFLSQLFQSGNSALILSLAAAGKDQASAAASTFGDVMSLSDQLGSSVAGATDQGKAIEKQTAKLEAKLDHLIKAGNHNARMIADAFSKPAANARRRARAA